MEIIGNIFILINLIINLIKNIVNTQYLYLSKVINKNFDVIEIL